MQSENIYNMIIDYEEEELEVFIFTGKSKDKFLRKLGRNKTFMRDLSKVMNILKNVERVANLRDFGSLNYEQLKGSRLGQSSVRIGYSSPYRLLFTEHDNGIRILIIEINYHYGDK